ncbi:hypothetical protein E2C01_057266 [Portunus trituberculatus]|uniref:Uncharacterized protein n=1 Tax=Portunus trituberculatus TaxID=210409 RepID=A0A5B7GZL2_PORTR|nr:hypothetical protein [Portunus trituberculatus]
MAWAARHTVLRHASRDLYPPAITLLTPAPRQTTPLLRPGDIHHDNHTYTRVCLPTARPGIYVKSTHSIRSPGRPGKQATEIIR